MKRTNYIKSILSLFTLAIVVFAAASAADGQAQLRKKFEFNGDTRADIALFSTNATTAKGSFFLANSPNDSFRQIQWGSTLSGPNTDKPVAGDFDGDGRGDFAVVRPVGNQEGQSVWYILNNAGTSSRAVSFGNVNDTPMPADYDGDGKDDVAVARITSANTITYYWQRSIDGQLGFRAVPYDTANAECRASVPGDYNGDARSDFVVRCRQVSTNQQYFDITDNVSNVRQRVFFGIATADSGGFFYRTGDVFVPGDYDGDGKTDIAVVRLNLTGNSGTLTWYIRRSSNGTLLAQNFGAYLVNVEAAFVDQPAPADYDGDGKTDLAVQRNSFPRVDFYIQSSQTGATRGLTFGYSLPSGRDDVALPTYSTSFAPYGAAY